MKNLVGNCCICWGLLLGKRYFRGFRLIVFLIGRYWDCWRMVVWNWRMFMGLIWSCIRIGNIYLIRRIYRRRIWRLILLRIGIMVALCRSSSCWKGIKISRWIIRTNNYTSLYGNIYILSIVSKSTQKSIS